MANDRIAGIASILSGFTIPEFNDLTLALSHLGIAASFNQFLPELENETPPPKEITFREADPNLDNVFGGREPG